MQPVRVHKGRTVVVPVSLGYDISDDIITSDIRVEKNLEAELIASWSVSFETDGTNGELILTLDDSVTSEIEQSVGYMDLKRMSGGQPLNVFDEPLEVSFVNSITV